MRSINRVLPLNANVAVYLHRGAIHFRKNISGLSAIVEHELRLDPFAHAAFVFGNRRKDRIKILGWCRNRLWLLQKRLVNARFVWPQQKSPQRRRSCADQAVAISSCR